MGDTLKEFSLPDSMAALRAATAHLIDTPTDAAVLLETEQKNRSHLLALKDYFVASEKLSFELEDQLWLVVYRYLKYLLLTADHVLKSAAKSQSDKTGDVLMVKIDAMATMAFWHYVRYRPLPANFWLNMHQAYAFSEECHFQGGEGKLSPRMRYLNALLLDSINRSNMKKSEIEHIDQWLLGCSREILLERQCNELKHLLFVDLTSHRSAQRLRDYETKENCRYWSMETIIAQLVDMRLQIEQGVVPAVFGKNIALPNAKRLLDQLSAEWSYQNYKRQRRSDEREGVAKLAQAVHGIMNVCQHIRNNAFNQMAAPLKNLLHAGNSWHIENESKFGFGALVNSGLNLWLKPGCLISLDYELNPDMVAVCVVRNIQQRQGTDCYAGIEVLSHTPAYVTLRLAGDVVTTASPALYLPQDEERDLPPSLIMAVFDYVELGRYTLKMGNHTYDAQLDTLMEQQEDWVRVSVDITLMKT